MRRHLFLILFISLLANTIANAQHEKLRLKIDSIARTTKGKVGVAICLLKNNDTLTYHNDYRYVLHSVMKFSQALTMLHEIDKGHFKLDQLVHVAKDQLHKTHSPLRDKFPEGNVDVSIKDLLRYSVSESDNNACDILYKMLGGPEKVEKFIHSLGVKQIAIKTNEVEMASAWPVQYRNWSEPYAQVELLKKFYNQSILSKNTNDYLWQIMLGTSTGPKRIKGLLPIGTQVAHKTGTGPTNTDKLTSATNDSGIILMPNGEALAISVFITDAYGDDDARELIIAQIAKAAFDEFNR